MANRIPLVLVTGQVQELPAADTLSAPAGVLAGNGSVSAPVFTFASDTDTGLYRYGTNSIGLSCNGTLNALFFDGGVLFGPPVVFSTGLTIATGYTAILPDGSASAPSYSFSGDSNTGIHHPAADVVAIATGGVERVRVSSTGDLYVGFGGSSVNWQTSTQRWIVAPSPTNGGTAGIVFISAATHTTWIGDRAGTTIYQSEGTSGSHVFKLGAAYSDADPLSTGTARLTISNTLVTASVPVQATDYYNLPGVPGGRLTLSSTLPVSTFDLTAQSTLYYLPHAHNRVWLYDGTNWIAYSFSSVSLALSGLTADKQYDVFLYANSGTPTLELLVWTNDTTRATALTTQDGRLVKSGAATRLYLGTIRTTGTTTTEDSIAKRFVWNFYNQAERKLYKTDSTGHSYSSGSWREWNGASGTHLIQWVQGTDQHAVTCWINMASDSVTNTLIGGVRIDGTDPDAGISAGTGCGIYALAPFRVGTSCSLLPSQGYHYAKACEWGGSATWTRYQLGGSIPG